MMGFRGFTVAAVFAASITAGCSGEKDTPPELVATSSPTTVSGAISRYHRDLELTKMVFESALKGEKASGKISKCADVQYILDMMATAHERLPRRLTVLSRLGGAPETSTQEEIRIPENIQVLYNTTRKAGTEIIDKKLCDPAP